MVIEVKRNKKLSRLSFQATEIMKRVKDERASFRRMKTGFRKSSLDPLATNL